MEFQEAKKIIQESQNIYLIPEENQNPESITSALALFYTLRNLGKNVNIIIEELPEYLSFLIPSINFISYPKNFVISIPSKTANVSQIYYEKNDDALKIHLTVENGFIKRDDLSFYFSEKKPDLVVTFGIKDYHLQLSKKLNPFGFLLDAQILNIDNKQNTITETDNKNFGKINLIGNNCSLTEITINLINNFNSDINKETANCLLAGLIIHTDNFKNFNVTAKIFETAAYLMKNNADLKEIINNIKRN